MTDDPRRTGSSRRDFLKLMSGALGGVVLAQGGIASGAEGKGRHPGPGTPLPNGYRFYRIFTPGTGDINELAHGAVMMNDNSEIVFFAQNGAGATGAYELTMNYAGPVPAIASMRRIVALGDVLADGRRVDRIYGGDTNRHGSFATVIGTDNDVSGVYLERNKGGLQPLIRWLDPIPGAGGHYGANFGDLDLHDGDDVLLTAHFSSDDDPDPQLGLFHLPGAQASNLGRVVLRTGDLIPGMDAVITDLGLLDRHDSGNFVIQAYGEMLRRERPHPPFVPPGRGNHRGLLVQPPSLVIQGNVHQDAVHSRVLTASQSLRVVHPQMAGETYMGPRIGPANDVALTTHLDPTTHLLSYLGQPVVRSNGRSPGGEQILGIGAPVVGVNGLMVCLVIVQKGMELILTNGYAHRTILRYGDRIDGQTVSAIIHGFHSDQMDAAGRIVFTAEFEANAPSVVLGIPV
jgi:hypothetical protein